MEMPGGVYLERQVKNAQSELAQVQARWVRSWRRAGQAISQSGSMGWKPANQALSRTEKLEKRLLKLESAVAVAEGNLARALAPEEEENA